MLNYTETDLERVEDVLEGKKPEFSEDFSTAIIFIDLLLYHAKKECLKIDEQGLDKIKNFISYVTIEMPARFAVLIMTEFCRSEEYSKNCYKLLRTDELRDFANKYHSLVSYIGDLEPDKFGKKTNG